MAFTNDEKAYLKALVEREVKHLKSEEHLRKPDSSLAFFVAQENYEEFVKSILRKLNE